MIWVLEDARRWYMIFQTEGIVNTLMQTIRGSGRWNVSLQLSHRLSGFEFRMWHAQNNRRGVGAANLRHSSTAVDVRPQPKHWEIWDWMSDGLNKVSGQDVVEKIKRDIQTLDKEITQARKDVVAARTAYDELLTKRKNNAREMNSLLQNKHAWTSADLERFTKVFQDEHVLESSEEAGKAALNTQQTRLDELFVGMLDKQRSLYLAEQNASDKVKAGSTYWTMLLMGLQFASFLAVYGFLEPRRRRILQQQLDDLKNEVKSGHSSSLKESEERLASHIATILPARDDTLASDTTYSSHDDAEPETLKHRVIKLYNRYKSPGELPKRDIEALATGALLAAIIVTLVNRIQ